MSNEKVSQLPTVTTSNNSDILYAIQNSISVQETVQQVSNRIFSNIALTYAGNPNGNVAGNQLQYLYDSANGIWWFCKTTGTATTTVWVPSFGAMTNGQIPIGSTGAPPVLGNIVAGSGISVVNGPGSITIASTVPGSSWNEIGTTSATMVANNGYVTSNPGLVTLTLPATSSFGTHLEIVGKGTGGWLIAQNAGQNLVIGSHSSTVGVGGSVASTNYTDSVYLICTTANTTWTAVGAPQGSLTVV